MCSQNISSLKLPFLFIEKRLLNDLTLLINDTWIPHFNTFGYKGNWKAISLLANNGDATNIFALPNGVSKIKETSILKKCRYFKEVIAVFKCDILSARILRLEPGAEIKPHKDHELGYEDGNFRIHIPITTNTDVCFILNGKPLKMHPGECWYTNVNYTHSVSNNGTTDRVHLVIDGKRNTWSDDLFFSLAPKELLTTKQIIEVSPETKKRMIEELQFSKLDAAKELVNKLQKELKQN